MVQAMRRDKHTPMAMTKFLGLFLKPNSFDMAMAEM